MTEQEFLEKIMDIMDTEAEITMNSALEEIEEWDSLSYISFLSLCTKFAKTRVNPSEVRTARTIRNLYELFTRE